MRQELYGEDELRVEFVLDEETGDTWIEIKSAENGPELDEPEDVVVALDGAVAGLDVARPNEAKAYLGVWEAIEKPGMELMIRVGEWFESWELA